MSQGWLINHSFCTRMSLARIIINSLLEGNVIATVHLIDLMQRYPTATSRQCEKNSALAEEALDGCLIRPTILLDRVFSPPPLLALGLYPFPVIRD